MNVGPLSVIVPLAAQTIVQRMVCACGQLVSQLMSFRAKLRVLTVNQQRTLVNTLDAFHRNCVKLMPNVQLGRAISARIENARREMIGLHVLHMDSSTQRTQHLPVNMAQNARQPRSTAN